ncbi:hypothetical protein C8J57DRAFT_1356324, partial [Mycena rebaudengoi]
MLLYLFLLSFGALVCGGLNQGSDESLLVNAIVAKNNISMAECWKIEPGFQISNVTGTVGDKVLALGNVSNALYIIIPDDDGKPNNGGLHNGAHAQWVFALTGGANVTFPEAPGGFSVSAGGLFISTDVRGHFYPWPSDYMGSWCDLHSSTFPRRSSHQPYRYCQPLMRKLPGKV